MCSVVPVIKVSCVAIVVESSRVLCSRVAVAVQSSFLSPFIVRVEKSLVESCCIWILLLLRCYCIVEAIVGTLGLLDSLN